MDHLGVAISRKLSHGHHTLEGIAGPHTFLSSLPGNHDINRSPCVLVGIYCATSRAQASMN